MATIWDPITIGNVEVKNRIAYPPMLSNLCSPDGYATRNMVDYYAARARGGAGMVTVEVHFISRRSRVSRPVEGGVPVIDDDTHIEPLKPVVAAIKENGAAAFAQMAHMGKYGVSGGLKLVPSAEVPLFMLDMILGPTVSKEMTQEDIDWVIGEYAQAARRFKEAGFDGAMIHGTHGFLPQVFMSPYTNKRTDKYGQDRLLFCEELLAGIKSVVGADFPIIFRMAGDEFLQDIGEQGYTVDDMKDIAPRLEQAGAAALDITCGTVNTPYWLIPSSYFPKGVILHLPEAVKKVVDIPVLGIGRINTPEMVRMAVEQDKCDIVNLGRAMIADPDFPNKMKEGREDEIRKCIACNTCLSKHTSGHVECTLNAEVGREEEYTIRKKAPERRQKVLIIGGGPAGMECARVAAMRGDEVHLYEKQERLGGQLNIADQTFGKQEIRNVVDYLSVQMDKQGVNVVLNTEATAELVEELAPDTIVVAVGGVPRIPDIPGIDKPHVVLADDVLRNKVDTGQKIVVIGGELVACEVAELLVEKGKDVTLCDVPAGGGQLAASMEITAKMGYNKLMAERGVSLPLIPNIQFKEITEQQVTVIHPDGREQSVEADTVVIAAGYLPNDSLAKALKGKTWDPPYVIGDCAQSGRIYDAIHDGARVGRTI
jgi:2,4-dienoyl-CoA reductase-like NADH-dependent reductase (Old Yellow Enzyme family)/thioredoxin reductase